jgi:ribosomal-protein-alanine N-acetyltransferase
MQASDPTNDTPHTSQYQGANNSPAALASGSDYPRLTTHRFEFRPFMLSDIGRLATLAGEHRVADTTIGIPHPYTTEFARMWISSHSSSPERCLGLHWAALNLGDDRIVGYVGLDKIDVERRQAELRFWVGCGVQRARDAIEWSKAIVDYALSRLNMERIYALQLARHPLAGRVLAAIGMRQEGLVRKRICNGGLMEDLVCWATLRHDWQQTPES